MNNELQAEPTKNAIGKDIIVTATATMGQKPNQGDKRTPTEASKPKKTKTKKRKSVKKQDAPPGKAVVPPRKSKGKKPKKEGLKYQKVKEVTGTRYARKAKKVNISAFIFQVWSEEFRISF